MKRKRNYKFVIIIVALVIFCSIIGVVLHDKSNKNESKNTTKVETDLSKEVTSSTASKEKKSEESMQEINEKSVKEITRDEVLKYGRNLDTYTNKNIIYDSNANIISLKDTKILGEIGCDSYIMKEYITAFAIENKLEMTEATLLDYCYVDTEDEHKKIFIFGQLDDKNKTLVR